MHRKPSKLRKILRALRRALLTVTATAGIAAVTAGAASAQARPHHPDARTCAAFSRWYDATEAGYRPAPALVDATADLAQFAGPAVRGYVLGGGEPAPYGGGWSAHPGQAPYIEAVTAVCLRVGFRSH